MRKRPRPPTESQARYGSTGLSSRRVPEIMSERVALGPELEQRLGLSPRRRTAPCLCGAESLHREQALRVRRRPADEIAGTSPKQA